MFTTKEINGGAKVKTFSEVSGTYGIEDLKKEILDQRKSQVFIPEFHFIPLLSTFK